jgi:hypothetical protein
LQCRDAAGCERERAFENLDRPGSSLSSAAVIELTGAAVIERVSRITWQPECLFGSRAVNGSGGDLENLRHRDTCDT